ncbi:hypothetical protein [Brevibacillus porteri]|uniref:hypothetical protein n=1 Tax=Brevibacillus porteri TaxID=2126350 RepID=UPI003D1E08AF
MSLKDIMATDLAVFLNIDEFADEIDIDGKKITGLIDPVEIGGGNRSYSYPSHDREYTEEIKLFVKRSDFTFIPPIGHTLKINKKMYVVVAPPVNSDGVLEIRLGGNSNP